MNLRQRSSRRAEGPRLGRSDVTVKSKGGVHDWVTGTTTRWDPENHVEMETVQEGESRGGTVAVQTAALVSLRGQEESNVFNLGT